MRTLEVSVDIVPLPLSKGKIAQLTSVERYDSIVFTSKHGQSIYESLLRKHRVKVPKYKMHRVGPREDLLGLGLEGTRVLFPRSDRAPFDIVRTLRSRGVTLTPVSIYTAHGRKLPSKDKTALIAGRIERLYFKSPSGIEGLLKQLPAQAKVQVRSIPALCIGSTTAEAARKLGWKKISIKKVL